MNKREGFIFTKLLPLLLLFGMVGLSVYLLAQKTGFLNRASELTTTTDYAISFSENAGIGSGNTATMSASYLTFSPNANPLASLVLKFPFTIEGWFKTPKPVSGNYLHVYTPLALHAWPSIVNYGYLYRLTFETQDSNGSSRPMFSVMKNNPQPFDHNNYLSVGGSSGVSLPADEWAHVAVTASSSGNLCYAQLFLNGKLVDSRTMGTLNCQTWTDSPTEFTIAKPISGEGGISGYYYPGTINEIRISDVTRYTADFNPVRTPLTSDANTIALWHFDQSVADASPNGNNGVVKGPVTYVDSQMVPPTASILLNFSGVRKNQNRILLTWQTGTETNIIGFNLYRATKKANGTFGKFVSLNSKLIPAKNVGKIQGASYRFTDDKVMPANTYQYKINVIRADNQIADTKTIKVKVISPPPD